MKYAQYVLVALLAVSFGVASTPNEGMDDSKWEKAKQAYISLLSSDNPGVKASAANFIRKYDIGEATAALKEILMCENCEVVKVSAAMALVHVAGEEGVKAIQEAAKTEENEIIVSFYEVIIKAESEKASATFSQN